MTITGTVYDATTGQPVPVSTLAVINASGQMTGEGTVANENGSFNLNVSSPNDCQIKVSSIGYQTLIADPFDTENSGQIFLFPSTTGLPPVTITAPKPTNMDTSAIQAGIGPSASTVWNTLKVPLLAVAAIFVVGYLINEGHEKSRKKYRSR